MTPALPFRSRRSAALAAALVAGVALLAGPTSPASAATGNPTAMTSGFYTDPTTQAATWVAANPNDWRAATIRSGIAEKPQAKWFGNWSGDIRSAASTYVAAADRVDKLPVLVAYNIPGRDCGSHSAGGAGSPEAYRSWVTALAQGIGSRPAVVVLEPDALAQLDCLPASERTVRTGLIAHAVNQFNAYAPNTWVYLDAGNARWIDAGTMAERLRAANVAGARGFALNVSNYHTTAESASFGNSLRTQLSQRYGLNKTFVVDTSRNGNGSNGEWCNPAGRRIGQTSQLNPGNGIEMVLWAKNPGESDGNCGVGAGTSAGQFSPDIAYRLVLGS